MLGVGITYSAARQTACEQGAETVVETPGVSLDLLQLLVPFYCHRVVAGAENLLGGCCRWGPAGRLLEQAGRGARVHLGWLWGVYWWSGMAYTW